MIANYHKQQSNRFVSQAQILFYHRVEKDFVDFVLFLPLLYKQYIHHPTSSHFYSEHTIYMIIKQVKIN